MVDNLEEEMATHSSIREFHGWRSLVGYSPWGLKESDTTFTTTVVGKNTLHRLVYNFNKML